MKKITVVAAIVLTVFFALNANAEIAVERRDGRLLAIQKSVLGPLPDLPENLSPREAAEYLNGATVVNSEKYKKLTTLFPPTEKTLVAIKKVALMQGSWEVKVLSEKEAGKRIEGEISILLILIAVIIFLTFDEKEKSSIFFWIFILVAFAYFFIYVQAGFTNQLLPQYLSFILTVVMVRFLIKSGIKIYRGRGSSIPGETSS